jgi:putative oxidoreductase
MNRFLDTDNDWILFMQRVVLGLVIIPHGAQKLFGAFGGFGYSASMSFFTDVLHLPAPVGFMAIMAETLGALAWIFGLVTRLAAIGVTAVMLGAIYFAHLPFGFFMNCDHHARRIGDRTWAGPVSLHASGVLDG